MYIIYIFNKHLKILKRTTKSGPALSEYEIGNEISLYICFTMKFVNNNVALATEFLS